MTARDKLPLALDPSYRAAGAGHLTKSQDEFRRRLEDLLSVEWRMKLLVLRRVPHTGAIVRSDPGRRTGWLVSGMTLVERNLLRSSRLRAEA
jgi:hypothetical protein